MVYGKEILVGEVAEYTWELFERVGEAYGLMIERVEVEGEHVQIFLEASSNYSAVQAVQIG